MAGKHKVLIVEDEALIAMGLRLYITNLDALVCGVVSTGKQAVQIAADENPDLVLMDIHLPGGMDGIQAAAAILRNRKTHIAFVTGYMTKEIIERTAALDPLAFLEKPVEMGELKKLLERL